ncbi:hypothetical protein CLAFUR0_13123 [Fulvia fulva]|nr:hypothetical protein CLAFUR0_13123 [Fulvia fulva]
MSRFNDNLGRKRRRCDNLDIDGTAALGGTQQVPQGSKPQKLDSADDPVPDRSDLPANSIARQKDPFGQEEYNRKLNAGELRYPIKGVPPSEWKVIEPEWVRNAMFSSLAAEVWRSNGEYYRRQAMGLPGFPQGDETDSDDEIVVQGNGEETEVDDDAATSEPSTDSDGSVSIDPEDFDIANVLLSIRHEPDGVHEPRAVATQAAAFYQTSKGPSHSVKSNYQPEAGLVFDPSLKRRDSGFPHSENSPTTQASSKQLESPKPVSKPRQRSKKTMSDADNGDTEDLANRYRNGQDWNEEEHDMMILLRYGHLGKPWGWEQVAEVIARTAAIRKVAFEMNFTKDTPLKRARWSQSDQRTLLECREKGWTYRAIAEGDVLTIERTVLECQLQVRLLMHLQYSTRARASQS